MSDEIKTQHGTIGLLMAECEQLRRDLAKAKAENARLAAIAIQYYEVIDELSHHWSTHRNEYDRFDLVQRRITELRENRGQALSNMLAPTIRELEQCVRVLGPSAFESTKAELYRLRSILHSDKNSEKVKS